MEYHPRYAQPFTLAEAIGLDVSTITDEIARLRNSLKHLQETQVMLRDYQSTEAPGSSDSEIQRALDENEVVIGSQTERISILKMALTEKGVIDNSHYDVPETPPATTHPPDPVWGVSQRQDSTVTGVTEIVDEGDEEGEGAGIHL